MIKSLSIKALYALALAEGEGVGTAYEYYAKRLVLMTLLRTIPAPRQILVAGLPEKYGASLDFLLLASELGATVVVLDDRPLALTDAQASLAAAQKGGMAPGIEPVYVRSDPLTCDGAALGSFDLVLSCEVLQRLAEAERQRYVDECRSVAPAVALFAPNAENPSHTTVSGLDGLDLFEMRTLAGAARSVQVGYLDMPPFPPGVTRSEAQRTQASSGRLEALVMTGLSLFAQVERFFPAVTRRSMSHIVYMLIAN